MCFILIFLLSTIAGCQGQDSQGIDNSIIIRVIYIYTLAQSCIYTCIYICTIADNSIYSRQYFPLYKNNIQRECTFAHVID